MEPGFWQSACVPFKKLNYAIKSIRLVITKLTKYDLSLSAKSCFLVYSKARLYQFGQATNRRGFLFVNVRCETYLEEEFITRNVHYREMLLRRGIRDSSS